MSIQNLSTTRDQTLGRQQRFGEFGKLTVDPRIAACVSLLALLVFWIWLFPQTGDGDAIMHFINAHDGLWQPEKLLGSWARFGAKLPLLLPAQFGVFAARCMSACISIACAWQTIRLAEDLKLHRAWLAAPLFIFQPFVFALAADTMTEMPFALLLVIAIRLWWAEKPLASCLVVGYLPLVRPEGFFFCALWGLLIVLSSYNASLASNPKTGRICSTSAVVLLAMLGWGLLLWGLACWAIRGQPTYFFRAGWAWPADSIPVYGRGSFFSYFNRWPLYCGPILLPLFLLGLAPLRRHRAILLAALALLVAELTFPSWFAQNILPWPCMLIVIALGWIRRHEKVALAWCSFLLIFLLHSILWWRGWFASCGLLRILACAGPVTAVIALAGFNRAGLWLAKKHFSVFSRQLAGVAAMVFMIITTIAFYVADPIHHRIFPLERCCDFARQQNLLVSAPEIILGDPMAQAYLKLPANPTNLMSHNCDRREEVAHFLKAPIGSAGFWDNQHAQGWFEVSIADLPALGFTVLYETSHQAVGNNEYLGFTSGPPDQRYVVIRKDREGKLPEDLVSR